MKNMIRIALVGLMALGVMGGAASARASSDQEVIQRGNCSQASDWKLRIRTDGPDRLDLEFEGGEVAGQQWRVQMRYNGTLVFSGTATSGVDGEFDVDVEVDNLAGQDTLQGKARNVSTGETCVGSVAANF